MKRLLLPLLAALALPTAVYAEPVWIEYHRANLFDYKKEKCPNNFCGFIFYVDVKSIVRNKDNVYYNKSTSNFGVGNKLWADTDLNRESSGESIDCKRKIITSEGKKIRVKEAPIKDIYNKDKNSPTKDLYNFVCKWK